MRCLESVVSRKRLCAPPLGESPCHKAKVFDLNWLPFFNGVAMKISLGNWWTTTNSLDEELKSLKNKVDHLKAQADDNITDADTEVIQAGKKRKREFEFWLSNVENQKSEYLQIEYELREHGPNRNLKARIEKKIEEVDTLIQQGQFPKGVVLDNHASTTVPMVTRSLVGQNCAENVETILKLLKEDGVFAIGVHGMGGVGKTTIVKEIHNCLLLDSNIAGQVYWVTASQDCSLQKLQNDIGKVVGLQDFAKEDNERKKALLFRRFSELENSVLIIDDLWDSYEMEKIGIPLESCGCKIVITTRKLEVCKRLPCQHIIRIVPLNKVDAWTLFLKKLGELPSDVEHIARGIVEECGGLPLALITIGCCMRGISDVWEWENALYELRKPASRQDLMEVEVFRILKFSFDRLKDHKVQNCFLSCVLFPEDQEIGGVELVDLWINEGLFDDMENQQDRVNKGHVILNRLVNACLLERNLFEEVKMHDLIRDMGIIITREHPLFIAEAGKHLKQVPEEEKWSKDLVKVSLSDNVIDKIPSVMAPRTPNLTVLMLNRNGQLKKIPDSFFVHMRALTHLDLSRTGIKRIPESVSDLENLRGLLLGDCKELVYVPLVAKLTKLRTLDLLGCDKLKEAPRGLETLKSIEELSYMPWDASDLIRFNKVVEGLTSLSSFRFWIRDPTVDESPPDFYAFQLYHNTIWVRGGQYGGNSRIIVVPATLEFLRIRGSEMKGTSLGNVFQPLGEAKCLKNIDIEDCRGLEYISGSSATQQGSSLLYNAPLKKLTLRKLPDLRSISKLESSICFAHLSYLEISECPKLKVGIPVLRTEQFLFPNLDRIRVTNCEEVKEIFETTMEATLSNPVLSLPKLSYIELAGLPELSCVYRGLVHCTTLLGHNTEIRRCPKLKWWRRPGGGLSLTCLNTINLNGPPCLPYPDHDIIRFFHEQTLRLIDRFDSISQPAHIPYPQRSNDGDATEWPTTLSL